jgi:hypothetical protein
LEIRWSLRRADAGFPPRLRLAVGGEKAMLSRLGFDLQIKDREFVVLR